MDNELIGYIVITVMIILGMSLWFSYMGADLCTIDEQDTKKRKKKRYWWMAGLFPFVLLAVTGAMSPVIQTILRHLGVE